MTKSLLFCLALFSAGILPTVANAQPSLKDKVNVMFTSCVSGSVVGQKRLSCKLVPEYVFSTCTKAIEFNESFIKENKVQKIISFGCGIGYGIVLLEKLKKQGLTPDEAMNSKEAKSVPWNIVLPQCAHTASKFDFKLID